MQYLKLFETYKSQKEIEELANLCISKMAEETYNWHDKYVWNPDEKLKKVDKYFDVKFLNPDDKEFNSEYSYRVKDVTNDTIEFYGYNKEFNIDEVELTWSESNKYVIKGLISINVNTVAKEHMGKFDVLKDFIENTDIQYKARTYKEDGTKGTLEYTNNNLMFITIYYPEQLLNEIRRDKKRSEEQGYDFDAQSIYFSIFSDFYSTTLHELQHAYDKYRSDGKALKRPKDWSKQQKIKSELRRKVNLDEEERKFLLELQNKYLNFPHEINARFTQAIQNMSFYKVNTSGEGDRFIIRPLSDVISAFKLYFEGWNNLSEKDQRRLIRKVSQFWHFEQEHLKEKNEK